ncbi:MAG: hypothetical protein O7C58_08835 [Rickettsia endosymbiont of Ixodes persulcatus]|nr:hypothetical protein [Rickettsia endosymbiont of Ixodes persulcatus]
MVEKKAIINFKDNLNKINTIGASIIIKNKKYSELNNFIVYIYFIRIPLKDRYEIKYYSDEAGKHEVTNDKQNIGDVYFTIKAANDDPLCEGIT